MKVAEVMTRGVERNGNRKRWIELLMAPGQLAQEYAHAHGRKVEEVITREVVTVTEAASLEEAVRLMERHHIKRLPVVRGDAMVGVISRANLLHAFVVGSPEATTPPMSDAAIHDALTATLDKEARVPHGAVNVVVENGIVDFEGVIRDERRRLALRTAGENIRGVKRVRDHRLSLDPGAVG